MESNLRIVHLGKYYPPSPGGIENHTQTLAQAQVALGADVRVVVTNHATACGRDVTFERFSRTPFVQEHDGQVRVIRLGRWANIAKFDVVPGLISRLREVASEPADVWHLHAPNITMMLAVLATPKIRPLVITHHSDIIRQKYLKQAIQPLNDALYRRASQILPTSPKYSEESTILKRFSTKLSPLPLGIDLTPFRSPSAAALDYAHSLKQQHGQPLWLMVGRLVYYKGIHVALEALQSVPGKLLVIGTGPLESDLKAQAPRLGVADRVVWHGRADETQLVGALHASTALWFPSIARSEGFGLVQVEAMASGCPVINTAIPGSGVSWVCRHEQEGLTAAVADARDFASAVSRLLREPGLRDRLVRQGRERAREFDWMAMGQRSLEMYHHTLALV